MCFRVFVHEVVRWGPKPTNETFSILECQPTMQCKYCSISRQVCDCHTSPDQDPSPAGCSPPTARSPFELTSVFSSITGEVAHPHGARLDRFPFWTSVRLTSIRIAAGPVLFRLAVSCPPFSAERCAPDVRLMCASHTRPLRSGAFFGAIPSYVSTSCLTPTPGQGREPSGHACGRAFRLSPRD
jgi:hypothetical protein